MWTDGDPDVIGNIRRSPWVPVKRSSSGTSWKSSPAPSVDSCLCGSDPLSGVTLTLLDESGDPVDGDLQTPGVQPVTTTTNGLGYYEFSWVIPGTYQVGQTQPPGYDSFGDVDGGDLDIIGDLFTPNHPRPGRAQ